MSKLMYPKSRKSEVTEKIHEQFIKDQYRWLEGDENGCLTEEVSLWTDEQNNFCKKILENYPERESLEKRFKPLLEVDSIGCPIIGGDRLFYSRRRGNEKQPSYYYRNSLSGEEILLLDPNEMDSSGLLAVQWICPSMDGKLLAYGYYFAGDENSTLQIIEVETGKKIDQPIPGKVHSPYFLPDNSGFVYSRLEDIENPYSRQVCFHRIGTENSTDIVIFEQYKTGPLATTWGPFGHLSEDGNYLFLGYATGTRSNDLWVVDFQEFLKTENLQMVEIAKGEAGAIYADIHGDDLYIYTNSDAPNGRIFKTNIKDVSKKEWNLIVPEIADEVIDEWAITAMGLLLTYQKNASTRLVQFDFNGNRVGDIPLPGIGSVFASCNPGKKDFFYVFSSFNSPTKIFHYDLEQKHGEVWEEIKVPVGVSEIVVNQKWFTSKDGTKVSMFIVHKSGLELNKNNPTIVYGYGGFGISITPSFNPIICTWVEDGGVYAVVNLRGGGEYGQDWHKAGTRENKERVFEDFESATEYLISQGYTCKEKVAAMGRSNGGLLAGAVLTRRPDLFKAIVCGVPLLDMIRFQSFLMARFWVPEYGTAENKEDFAWLIKYSPYHNVKTGTRYPSTFIFTAENDTRVHPMHARKMAALLQDSTSADPDDAPILLSVDRLSGHGMGKPLNLVLEETLDIWTFLRWQLGLKTT